MIVLKICPNCGAQQQDDAVFCDKCASPFGVIPDQPQQKQVAQPQQQFAQPQQQFAQPQQQFVQPQQQFAQPQQQFVQPQQQFVQPQQQFAQPQAPFGAAPKKSKKKLIIIISVIAAVMAITLVILFVFVFKSKKDLIVGTWQEVKDSGKATYTRFNKDGTVDLSVGSGEKANYAVDGDKLTITIASVSQIYTIQELTSDRLVLTTSTGKTSFTVTFKKVDDDSVVKEANSQAKLKTANANAKLGFTTINNKSADLMADGEAVSALNTNGVVAVESFKDSSDPLEKAVYDAFKDNGDDLGYIYIRFDPNNYDDQNSSTRNFVQWSKEKQGDVVGQYPDPVKETSESDNVVFGTYCEKK